jgi:hypothetical protein
VTTTTLGRLVDEHGVQVDEHLDRDLSVPVSAGLQRQGDIIVIPAAVARPIGAAVNPVPPAGVAVVRGENGGHTHLLLAAGEVFYDPDPASGGGLDLGVLTVAPDAVGYLAHPEHGYCGIAPGTYTVRRQREQADEIRVVAD